MTAEPPTLFKIEHDDHHAEYVGTTSDGGQFFLTTPFLPGRREFVALFRFNVTGALHEAVIEDFGPREGMDEVARKACLERLLQTLPGPKFCAIQIAPFTVTRFGVDFGFIPQAPEEDGADWSIILEPGNFMCFWPPWDSGYYDT